MNIREAFPAFTVLFKYCRPTVGDIVVYSVDAGSPTDHNLVMSASEFKDEEPVGETHELIIAKEWVLENLEKILKTVPESA